MCLRQAVERVRRSLQNAIQYDSIRMSRLVSSPGEYSLKCTVHQRCQRALNPVWPLPVARFPVQIQGHEVACAPMIRPVLEVADVVRARGRQFLKRFKSSRSDQPLKAFRAVERCPFEVGSRFTMQPPGSDAFVSTLTSVQQNEAFTNETVIDDTRVVRTQFSN